MFGLIKSKKYIYHLKRELINALCCGMVSCCEGVRAQTEGAVFCLESTVWEARWPLCVPGSSSRAGAGSGDRFPFWFPTAGLWSPANPMSWCYLRGFNHKAAILHPQLAQCPSSALLYLRLNLKCTKRRAVFKVFCSEIGLFLHPTAILDIFGLLKSYPCPRSRVGSTRARNNSSVCLKNLQIPMEQSCYTLPSWPYKNSHVAS